MEKAKIYPIEKKTVSYFENNKIVEKLTPKPVCANENGTQIEPTGL